MIETVQTVKLMVHTTACQPEMSHYVPECNTALLISTTINICDLFDLSIKYLLSELRIILGLVVF